jgi:hypothetical protein
MNKLLKEGSKLVLANGDTYVGREACESFIVGVCNAYAVRCIRNISQGFGIGCAVAALAIGGSIVYDHIKTKKKEKLVNQSKKNVEEVEILIDRLEKVSEG